MATNAKATNKPSSKTNTNKTPDNNLAVNTNAETAGANKEGTENSTENGDAAANDANPETQSAEQKAANKRVTLMSALEAGDAVAVAEVLIKQGRSEADIKGFASTFELATKSFAEVVAKQEAEDKAKAEAKAKADAELEKIKQQQEETIQAAKKSAIDAMIADLISKNVNPDLALKIANSTLGGGTRTGGAAPKATVKVKYKNDIHTVKVTGNDKEAIKAMIAESGLSRADFIKQYQIAE